MISNIKAVDQKVNCIHLTGYSNCDHPDKGWLIFGKGCILIGNGFATQCRHRPIKILPTQIRTKVFSPELEREIDKILSEGEGLKAYLSSKFKQEIPYNIYPHCGKKRYRQTICSCRLKGSN